jgi:hypothetical protein
VRSTVGRWLRQRFPDVQATDTFDFALPSVGAMGILVDVVEIFKGRTVVVRIMAPLLLGAQVSDDLLRFIGQRSGDFVLGNLALIGTGRNRTLVFSDALLADALTEEDLVATVLAVAATADDMDLDAVDGFKSDEA